MRVDRIIKKKIKPLCAALALLFTLFALGAPDARAQVATNVNRFNVVLVVDKSGSLADYGGVGTDPKGLRFDALRLFLGLLTEDGNNVGVVVFDEQIRYESEPKPMTGMAEKTELVRTLEGFSCTYDTDIGSAVLRAAEMLTGMREENGLPCMILLFSDGKTDFSMGNIWAQIRRSWDQAQKALDLAKSEGITINGVLLNVDGVAKDGAVEFKIYTEGTNGSFEEITSPDSLTGAFRRFYSIINNTEYTGTERVAFSPAGEAETGFAVPGFGVEEVNVVIEHETDDPDAHLNELIDITITDPAGERFSAAGHEIISSRYILVKIPRPASGEWRVRLRGEPGDTVDITMVYNASMSVHLGWDAEPEEFLTHTDYTLYADVTDPNAPELNLDALAEMNAELEIMNHSDGSTGVLPLEVFDDTSYYCDLRFDQPGEYTLSALVGYDGFEVRSNALTVNVGKRPFGALIPEIRDMLSIGRFLDDCWELELGQLFTTGADGSLTYSLSDDLGGELTIIDGTLQTRFRGERRAAFLLTAEDGTGESAQVFFNLSIPSVTTSTWSINNMMRSGEFAGDCWRLNLRELFDDPKQTPLRYEISDDHGGAVTVSGDWLEVRPRSAEALAFDVKAVDIFTRSAQISFKLPVPTVTARTNAVRNMLQYGRFQGNDWSMELDGLFDDPKQVPLRYRLSDDCGGALSLEGSTLHMDLEKCRSAEFSLFAADLFGLEAELPFSLTMPKPTALTGPINEIVKTGLFQEGSWERRLDELFREPKGTALHYELSDDFGGAVKLEDGSLRVQCKGLGAASFTLKATDEYGESAELPITIKEKNMNVIYALWGLGIAGGSSLAAGALHYYRKRYR